LRQKGIIFGLVSFVILGVFGVQITSKFSHKFYAKASEFKNQIARTRKATDVEMASWYQSSTGLELPVSTTILNGEVITVAIAFIDNYTISSCKLMIIF
jgi:hypothetical protein